jgi:NAD(P)-dependent dehydrogenase (short-subunit alcohol dehydrogenase family)
VIALVTGANRGIGREIAGQLARRGHLVLLTARDSERAAAAAASVAAETGGNVIGLRLDVADPDSVAAAFTLLAREHGRLDVLVNNAGVLLDGDRTPSTADVGMVARALDTNLLGAWRCAAAAVPLMRSVGAGRIVNVSSTLGSLTGTPSVDARMTGYRVSKAALNLLTQSLAAELAGSGILVNACCPGYTRTGMGPDATRSPAEGADTPVWLATLPADGPTGGFFEDRRPTP